MNKEKVHSHTCTRCGKYYGSLELGFYKNKRGREGYGSICKGCYREDSKKRYSAMLEKVEKKEKLENRKYKHYSEEELMYIEKSWGSVSIERMAKKLGRTPESIRIKCNELGLGTQIDSMEMLIKRDIVQLLNVDTKTVSRYVERHGLNIKKSNVFRGNRILLTISFDDFLNWLYEHEDLINWSKVDKLGLLTLGFEANKLEKLIEDSRRFNFRRELNDKEKEKIKEMYLNFYKYETIANKLGKEYQTVKWYLHTCFESGELEKNDLKGRFVRDINRANFGWTEEQDRTLIKLFREGKTLKEISEIVGKSLHATKSRNQKLGRLIRERKLVI